MNLLNSFRQKLGILTRKIINGVSICLVMYSQSQAQGLFVVDNTNKIYELNSSNTLVYAGTINTSFATGDIAIAPNGMIYGLENDYTITSSQIIQFDLSTNSTTVVGAFPSSIKSVSLVCGNDNELYALGYNFDLWKYNLTTGVSTYLDNLGTGSPGDITFYKGNIIFQDAFEYNIKAYNLKNGTLRTILCKKDDNPIWGISNRFTDCGNEVIIATDMDNNFYVLDFVGGTFDLMNVDKSILPPGVEINGLASLTEHWALNCNAFQFENVNCSVGLSELNVEEDLEIFPNPASSILNLASTKTIESITFFDLFGKTIRVIEQPGDQIDLNFLNHGVYYASVSFGETQVVRKIEVF